MRIGKMKLPEIKYLGKLHTIKIDNKVYEYQIVRYSDEDFKSIRYKGIVTYQEAKKLNEKLRKKYKWLKEMN